MKKIFNKLILISVFMNVFCILTCIINNQVVYAVPNSITETMSKEEIMNKFDKLEKENEILKDKYSNLKEKLADEKIEIEKKKESVDRSIFGLITIGSSVLGVLSMGGAIYVKKHIQNKVKKLYENKINCIIENEINKKLPKEVSEQVSNKAKEEIQYIERIVNKYKTEQNLKKEKNIFVLSKNKEEEKLLKDSNLLNQFEKVKMDTLGNKIDDLSKYDVIVFNDINGYLTDGEMNEMIRENSNENAVYFYFNKHNSNDPKKNKIFKCKENENTNFAKSNATFVGNLIDLMKYQDDVLRNKKSNNKSIDCIEDIVMKTLLKHEGEKFSQKMGQEFTYEVKGKYIVPSTTNYNIPISDIVKGFKRGTIKKTTQLQDLRGPSYIYAFINDDRFKIHYKKIPSNGN